MNEPFDFSLVPYTFGMCMAEECPRGETCLRRIALLHAPAKRDFLPILNPNQLKTMNGDCPHYCSNEKVRFARGFMCTINALTVRSADSFRYKMIGLLGRKNYYLKRKGELNITLDEQKRITYIAKQLGVVLDDYFDGYVEAYNWE